MNKFRSLETIIRSVVAGKETSRGYTCLENAIRRVVSEQRSKIENDQGDQIAAGSYKTKNFEMGGMPAQGLYTSLPKTVNPDDAEKCAILQDQLFALQKQVVAKERATPEDVADADQLVKRIMLFAKKMNLEKEHSYVNKSFNDIKQYETTAGDIIAGKTQNSEIERRFTSPPRTKTKERDTDLDNTKFLLSRNLKAQRKLKIIDND